MAVYWLGDDNDDIWFPDPRDAEDSGLIAVGGDLSLERLILAYTNGFFPWYSYKLEEDIHWFCPQQRFVIFPEEIHISHSMRQVLRKRNYEVTFNKDFEGVMRNCGKVDNRCDDEGAWLGEHIIEAYMQLYRLGFAYSVEVWEKKSDDNGEEVRTMVGGLYGVSFNNVFVGESMFSMVPNGSKIALIYLATALKEKENCFIDCQIRTDHLESMGGRYIPYDEYMEILKKDIKSVFS